MVSDMIGRSLRTYVAMLYSYEDSANARRRLGKSEELTATRKKDAITAIPCITSLLIRTLPRSHEECVENISGFPSPESRG